MAGVWREFPGGRAAREISRARGFTLMEMIVVVTVIAIAASIVVSAVGGDLRSSRLRLAANMVAADLEFCESECINQPNAPRSMIFDMVNNQYSVVNRADLMVIANPGDGMPYTNDFTTGRSAQMNNVRVTAVTIGGAAAMSFGFDQYGKPLTGGKDVSVTLSYNGSLMVVTVSGATGDVGIVAGN